MQEIGNRKEASYKIAV